MQEKNNYEKIFDRYSVICNFCNINSLFFSIVTSAENEKVAGKVNILFDEGTLSDLTGNDDDYDISVFIEFAYTQNELVETDNIIQSKDRKKRKNIFKKFQIR